MLLYALSRVAKLQWVFQLSSCQDEEKQNNLLHFRFAVFLLVQFGISVPYGWRFSGLILTTRLFPDIMIVSFLCIYALYFPFLLRAVLLTNPKRIYLTDFKPFFWSTRVISNSDHLLQNVCKFSQYNAMCEFYVFISLLK